MKPRFNWRHQYDDKRDEAEGLAAATFNTEESLTQQSFKDDADLNVIARRFGLNDIPIGQIDPSVFRDTTNDPDLVDVLEAQREARDAFMSLPAKLRRRFHNSPKELWDFVTDPENAEEAIRLGFLTRAAPPAAPSPSDATTTPPAPAGASKEPQKGSPKDTEGEPKKAPQTP